MKRLIIAIIFINLFATSCKQDSESGSSEVMSVESRDPNSFLNCMKLPDKADCWNLVKEKEQCTEWITKYAAPYAKTKPNSETLRVALVKKCCEKLKTPGAEKAGQPTYNTCLELNGVQGNGTFDPYGVK
jgi:hypothetical protein